MKRLNVETILSNIKDAREQLEKIDKLLQDENLSEIEFQAEMEHLYHHLNVAWNIRHESSKKYSEMSEKDFNKWSKFPKKIKPFKLKSK